jgi:putative flippase GtrA
MTSKAFKFVVIGGCSTLIDFCIYMIISQWLNITISKVISMSIASIFSFILNKSWTFSVSEKTTNKMLVLFYAGFLINIAINTGINTLSFNLTGLKVVSFCIATGVAMVENFLFQNFIVFSVKKQLPKKERNNYSYSVIVPCYNESENLKDLVKALESLPKKYNIEFILVENGSLDDSRKVFETLKSPRIKKVYVDKNKGYGFGVISGLKKATGDFVGWLHADLQVDPKYMIDLIDYAEHSAEKNLFLKGKRKNRPFLDHFFTGGMTVYETLLLKKPLNDIGAIPVLFNRELLKSFKKPPDDFSIELYSLYKARVQGFTVKRFKVILKSRKKGASSWNKGFKSKIRQSRTIMKDSRMIKKGEYK